MKKFLIIITLFLAIFITSLTVNVSAKETKSADLYENFETEFRAVWVSYYTSDLRYESEEKYKEQINTILDNLEYYNINAMIFHIRSNHDAWYNSKINKINSQLSSVNFEEFDPLTYVIEETHKRGIEFHAWLNPYRLGSTYTSAEKVAEAHASYPNNPASNANNVLMGSTLQILDPGIPEVRSFIVDTCLEIVENYDVDAIHFDDYFYAAGIDDSKTIAKYNTTNLSTSDFRRKQVDTFIYDLKNALDDFNQKNNRYVQLGISPTGVYKNANTPAEAATPLSEYRYNENGDLVYPIGATTGCQMHYESYLYCDTLKWVNNEWINYILPQTYWSTTHGRAPFEKLINWWNMAVKNKNVNLYAGMGLYMWPSETGEARKRLDITDKLENVKGTSIYSYGSIRDGINGTNDYLWGQMATVKTYHWDKKTVATEIKGFDPIKLGSVENFVVNGNSISFSKMNDAKFYIIFRDKGGITYENSQVADVIYATSDLVSWTDPNPGDYIYDVVPVSYTNTLGEPTVKVAEYEEPTVEMQISLDSTFTSLLDVNRVVNIEKSSTPYIKINSNSVSTNLADYKWSSSNKNVMTIDESGKLTINTAGTTIIEGVLKNDSTKVCKVVINVYEKTLPTTEFTVTFKDNDGEILKIEKVQYGKSATAPANPTKEPNEKYTFEFAGWDKNYFNITSDLIVTAIYEPKFQEFTVTFVNHDDTVIEKTTVLYGHSAIAPKDPIYGPTVEHTFKFNGWDKEFNYITEDTIVKALYTTNDNIYTIEYVTNCDQKLQMGMYFYYESIYEPHLNIEGKILEGWYYDSEFTKKCSFPITLSENTKIYAKWNDLCVITYYNNDNTILTTKKIVEGSKIIFPSPNLIEGFAFKGWMVDSQLIDKNYVVNSDIEVFPLYVKEHYVYFYDYNKEVIDIQIVEENGSAVAPEIPYNVDNYVFTKWDTNFTNVTSELHVYSVYSLNEVEDFPKEKGCKNCNSTFIWYSIVSLGVACYFILKRNK